MATKLHHVVRTAVYATQRTLEINVPGIIIYNRLPQQGDHLLCTMVRGISPRRGYHSRVLKGVGSPEVPANRGHQVGVPFGLLSKVAEQAHENAPK